MPHCYIKCGWCSLAKDGINQIWKNILPNGDIFFLILFYVHGYVFYGFCVTYATGPNTLTRKGFYSDLTSETPSSMIDK